MSIDPQNPDKIPPGGSPGRDDATSLPPKLQEAMQLISALCDESISPDQFETLQFQVCNDPEILRFYVRMMHLHAGLYYFASALPDMMYQSALPDSECPGIASDESDQGGMYETMVLPAMRATTDSEEDFTERFSPAPASLPVPKPQSLLRLPLIKGGIAAAILILLGLAAVYLPSLLKKPIPVATNPPVQLPDAAPVAPLPVPSVPAPVHLVATLQYSSNPEWVAAPVHSGGFAVDDRLQLLRGAVQLNFANGGRLVVEGPADVLFSAETELQLNSGRIVANYPGGGLVVKCPTGSVKDLGTEFGLAVDPTTGHCDVEVFEGTVSAALSTSAATQPSEPQLVKAGQAVVLTEHNLTPDPRGAIPQRFICNIANQKVQTLDVIDLICGGDGTSHRRGIAVDSLTGAVGVLPPVGLRTGDLLYHKTVGYPVIDGAFIPDGTNGPMTVDSGGHRFAFGHTTNQTTNEIWTGGSIPWGDELGISTVLGGQDYSVPEHSILCTHCDNAITLDLDAIRRIYPDRALAGFHCRFGNSYVNGLKGAVKMNPVATVYVLLDGQSAYEKRNFSNQDGTFGIDVPLRAGQRFLTLAAVDDGKDIDRDWILWTDARIAFSAVR
jgi:hypothetical protein